jgi:hypothetical protein
VSVSLKNFSSKSTICSTVVHIITLYQNRQTVSLPLCSQHEQPSSNFSLIHTLGSVRGSLVVLPDLENMGMAIRLSVLSCIEADIHVISYQLPVISHHLGFPAYTDFG